MSKQKILMTASTFPRYVGDTEPRFILDFAKAMNRYFDVTVLAPMDPSAVEEEVIEGVKVIRYHYFPVSAWETLCYPGAIVSRIKEKKTRIFLVPFLFLALKRKLKKIVRDYDYVHAHWLIPQGIIQSGFEVPYIITGHGGDVTSLNVPVIRGLKKRCLQNAKHITVVSKALADYVQELYPNDKTTVLSMGCDTSRFDVRYRKENLYNQGDKKVVLFVGRLAEKKGVTYLIEAMKTVEDAVLVIVGKGALEKPLKEQAAPQGDKIRFLGPKTHDELPELYASADVFVAPSVTAADGDKEGLGLVILEAMASGLPVVASESGGITDLIESGVNGLLAPEKDVETLSAHINTILKDAKLRDGFIRAGFETVRQYDYAYIAERYREILVSEK